MYQKREALLIEMDRQGVIPGPGEPWAGWEKRITDHAKLSSSGTSYPAVLEVLEWYWGIAPSWVEVKEKETGFWPWHAASCDISEEGHVAITVNPGAAFFCSLDEILIHEMSHAARAAFQEGCFDEYLAYSLSSSSIRRWWGPFFSKKSYLPIIWLISWLVPSGLFCLGLLASVKVFYCLIGGSWLAAFIRHHLLQSRYSVAWNKLREKFPEEIARWMLFRLSEEEALLLADDQFSIVDLLKRDEPRSKLFQLKLDNVERV